MIEGLEIDALPALQAEQGKILFPCEKNASLGGLYQ